MLLCLLLLSTDNVCNVEAAIVSNHYILSDNVAMSSELLLSTDNVRNVEAVIVSNH